MSNPDVLVVGSGIAGLFTALKTAARGQRVAIVTKGALEESNTRYAQGGIAAALSPSDSPDLHARDTMAAGAGLCDPVAVKVLCGEGPDRIADLLAWHVEFDRDAGELARGREGAHQVARVLHAGGDATGARIETALAAALRQAAVPCQERAFVSALLVEDGRVVGVTGPGIGDIRAGAVVLASGGAGQVYQHTTNPPIATGDGVAAAFRAGALVGDVEFFQFHPTALAVGARFLISEAVRGEGAVLRDQRGERFVDELAPRDVVARAIVARMEEQDGQPVLLDATHLGAEFLRRRFPRIDAHCRAQGLDWARESIPVTPAAHYWMGGVVANIWGETSLPGLYAVGEVADTGVHGANRLASNSLLEGVVFGARIAARLDRDGRWEGPPADPSIRIPRTSSNRPQQGLDRVAVRALAWDHLGLARTEEGITKALDTLADWERQAPPPTSQREHETANLSLLARLIGEAARARYESRGAHYRTDVPAASQAWQKRITLAC